ncbi:MAG: hypothetical protein HOP29_13220 [Phycisphaerales bacterium]|nr:hypothetical protein [Phycisphaerales bacterium]
MTASNTQSARLHATHNADDRALPGDLTCEAARGGVDQTTGVRDVDGRVRLANPADHPGDRSAAEGESARRIGGGWWRAIAAGAIASFPMGWLLSFGAMLPAMLGLFFFALFGLVIGAVMYRVASRHRPIPVGRLRIGIWAIVAVCWAISMYFEVRDFAGDKAREALHRVQLLPDGMTRETLLLDAEKQVHETLKRDHGGDGFFGYAHWIVTSSRIEYRVATMDKPVVLTSVQNKGWWVARVVLSIVLLWFGVRAQVMPLSRVTDRIAANNQALPPNTAP